MLAGGFFSTEGLGYSMSANPTIFVVDDDTAVQDSLRVLLESANHTVKTFGSGLEFLQADQACSEGCLVLDLDLPVMSGLKVFEELAARNSDMPVILITGRADKATRERCLRNGAVVVLEKPIRDGHLLEAIGRALARGQRCYASEA